MSDRDPYKISHDNYGRRTWDTSEYEKLAKARSDVEKNLKESNKKKVDLYAAKDDPRGSDSEDSERGFEEWDVGHRRDHHGKDSSIQGEKVQRALLKQREYKVDLDSKLGKSQVVSKLAGSSSGGSQAGGYYCDVCDCVVKDSINFLDHINGKKHQRNLGMSMKVERSSLDQVKARFQVNKKKAEEKQKEYDLGRKVTDLREEQDKYREYKREKKRAKKRKFQEEDQDGDDDMAAIMGFSGFSTSKKN